MMAPLGKTWFVRTDWKLDIDEILLDYANCLNGKIKRVVCKARLGVIKT